MVTFRLYPVHGSPGLCFFGLRHTPKAQASSSILKATSSNLSLVTTEKVKNTTWAEAWIRSARPAPSLPSYSARTARSNICNNSEINRNMNVIRRDWEPPKCNLRTKSANIQLTKAKWVIVPPCPACKAVHGYYLRIKQWSGMGSSQNKVAQFQMKTPRACH